MSSPKSPGQSPPSGKASEPPARSASEARGTRAGWPTAITYFSLLLLVVAINLWMVAPFFLAVLMGAILAMLTSPIYKRLLRFGMSPAWAAALVTVGVTLLIIGPMVGMGFIAARQAIKVAQTIAEQDILSIKYISSLLERWGLTPEIVGDAATLEAQIRDGIQRLATAVSGAALNMVRKFPNYGVQIALLMLAFFFLLIDGKRFVAWAGQRVPLEASVRARLYAAFKDTSISVVWATLAAAAAQAALMWLSFVVLSVPMAVLAGGTTFVFAWIPLLGSTPVWMVGAIYLYTQGELVRLLFMIALGLLTGVTDNFVRPLVLKGRGKMHPLVSLVAIFGAIRLFGLLGVFIGPILAAILLSLLQIWPLVGQRLGLPLVAPPEPTAQGPTPPKAPATPDRDD